jgi:arginine deiminase
LYQRFAYIRKMNYFCFKQVLKLGTMIQTLRVVLVGLVVSLLSSTAFAQRYPQAEWDYAKVILMHTPGEELFDGVIHPYAGLFEYYFDVDKAAEEHRGYIEALELNGIKVHTIREVLNQVPIDKLRTCAMSALTYDTSALTDTAAVENETYKLSIIDQMSRADLIRCMLLRPTVKLYKTSNNTGVEAVYTHSPLINLYFTRDQSITTPRGLIIAQMNSTQRADETHIVALCYEQLGMKPILSIDGAGRLEGGDYLRGGTISYIGCGMRTNLDAIEQIMRADAFGHDTVAVVNDHKWWQMQMHLDTYFNIIDKDLCTLVESRYLAKKGDPEWVTVDLYTRKPGEKKYTLSHREIPFVEFLKQRGFTIIPIKLEDELHYANNFLTIAPRHIMAVGNQSKALQRAFAKHGVQVEWIPLETLIKGYGAAHCMTQVIKACQ